VDQGRETVAWGCYVHVPFCATRCGYCDFNTYTASELGPGASRTSYADTVIAELRLARAHLPEAAAFDTVFFGGGTPTLLGPSDLVRILHAVRSEFGLSPMAEVTTEANPDSIDEAGLAVLREGGFTRVSFGVQSLAPQVLATLERTHTPGRSLAALREARDAGFEHVSADLIYATPGETNADLANSVAQVLSTGIDHLSAYSLIVEEGTRLAARVRRGEIPEPDDDVAAERYRIIDEAADQAGSRGTRCPTGPSPAVSVGTISAIGGEATGGAQVLALTGILMGVAGGTSSIRRRMRPWWPKGRCRSREKSH